MTEHPTPERYVAGSLTDEEVARFEESMIERPALAADVNVRRRIKAGLELLEQRHELDPLLAPAARQPQVLRYAAAAAVLVVVAGVWSAWRYQGPSATQALIQSSEIGGARVAATFVLARTRAAGAPDYSVQQSAGLVKFRILVEDPDAVPFAVTLARKEASDGGLPTDDASISQTTDGFAEIYLDPRELSSGSYELVLKSGAGSEQRFPFTLRIAPQ
ncbi:MAG TPA: hypothetical protein VFU13_02410 [Steroidobacteraceae bacterium]|nr:hypothetical protein [Steroidobacteraceae bacterium]